MVECAFPSFESLIGWANVGPTFSRELSSIGSINVEGTFPRPCFSPASRVSHFCPTNIGGTDPGFRICRSFANSSSMGITCGNFAVSVFECPGRPLSVPMTVHPRAPPCVARRPPGGGACALWLGGEPPGRPGGTTFDSLGQCCPNLFMRTIFEHFPQC